MAFRKWEIGRTDKTLAKMLAEECDVDPFVALIASSRGYTDPEALEEYLSDEPMFNSAWQLPDMEKAVVAIRNAIKEDRLIAVYGDYDCDGVTATALMTSCLHRLGARVIPYIPHRIHEGYGMNRQALDALKAQDVSLIVTVDNGVSCVDEVAYAKTLHMDVVVTDHHLPPEKLPDALAVVDPHLPDCSCDFADLCGAAVAFKLACALMEAEPEELMEEYGDLAAIGTIGDVMPLTGENRCLVKLGLAHLGQTTRLGLQALFKAASIDAAKADMTKVAFGVVPRLNAAGRVGSADRAYRLLVCEDEEEAKALAAEIVQDNVNRQQIEKEILKQATALVEQGGLWHDRVIVVAGENWHHGVVGIVAARLCELYGKPTVVLSLDDTMAHGSARSIEGFSIYQAVSSCNECLEHFGGHALAAGVSMKKECVPLFCAQINRYAACVPPAFPVLHLDCRLNPAVLSLDLVEALSELSPFGSGNPQPVFGLFGVVVQKIVSIGNGRHVRLSFQKGACQFQAVFFGVCEEDFAFKVGEQVDLAVTLDNNEYDGRSYLSVVIRDMRPTGIDDQKTAAELTAYHDFCRGLAGQYDFLMPDRTAFAAVYKCLQGQPLTKSWLCNRFSVSVGYGKTAVICDALIQLGLLTVNDHGRLCVHAGGQKVDLMTAPILERLNGQGR